MPLREELQKEPIRQGEIARIIGRLHKLWTEHPELRLGQLLENAVPSHHDLYYVTDGALESSLQRYAEELERQRTLLAAYPKEPGEYVATVAGVRPNGEPVFADFRKR